MYILGIGSFLISLKIGFIKYQLRRLAWSAIVLIFVLVFSFVQIYNLFKGFYWVVFPLLCVPVSSAFATLVGMLFGKTPLNRKHMPTKTVEGYIGGIVLTAIWSYFAADYLAQFQYLACTQTSFQWQLFDGLSCTESPVFRPRLVTLSWLPLLGTVDLSFQQRPVQLHSVIISLFASTVSPFGQFIVMGFKKAFNIKSESFAVALEGSLRDILRTQGTIALFVFFYLS